MPELPDIELYLRCLGERVVGQKLNRLRSARPFVLRTFDPPAKAVEGLAIKGLRRIGKRIVLEMDAAGKPLFVVIHLMISGRFRWTDKTGVKPQAKIGLASFEFDHGTL